MSPYLSEYLTYPTIARLENLNFQFGTGSDNVDKTSHGV
jgi:hypothetical protein